MQNADLEALFRRWVDDYYQDVYRWCFRYVGNAHDASDLTQETFTHAFRHVGAFRGESSPRTWLLSIATRTFLKSRWRETRREEKEQRLLDSTVEADGSVESAEAAALERVSRDTLWELVRSLPVRERIAITLFYAEDLSYNEIAQAMDVNLQQVRNFIHRGRRRLKQILEEGAMGSGETGFGLPQ